MKYLWVRLSVAFSSVILIFIVLIILFGAVGSGWGGRSLPPELSARMKAFEILPPEMQQHQIQQALVRLSHGLAALALTGGTIGLVAGVWMSRILTEPLRRLAEAARSIGTGDFSRRVNINITSTQEIIDVAIAFNQMASELETATQFRNNLMADVAHELRTPLTVLQGNLRAILDDVYAMDKAEITRLYEQTRHLTQLVEDLRVVALAESRQLPLNLEEVDAVQLLRDVYASFGSIAAEEGVHLSARLPDEDLRTRIDTARIKQVIYNLLSNAIRHTPRGGDITLAVGSTENEICIRLSDTGEGITAEHLDRVFDRFYRVDPARAHATGGIGLGLAIVKAIVETHNGHVSVSSEGTGKGATFTIWLPRYHLVVSPD